MPTASPKRANSLAVAKPMPLHPPVTKATRDKLIPSHLSLNANNHSLEIFHSTGALYSFLTVAFGGPADDSLAWREANCAGHRNGGDTAQGATPDNM
jgi:hypothetical protein